MAPERLAVAMLVASSGAPDTGSTSHYLELAASPDAASDWEGLLLDLGRELGSQTGATRSRLSWDRRRRQMP